MSTHVSFKKKALSAVLGTVLSTAFGLAGAGGAPPVPEVEIGPPLTPAEAIGTLKGAAIPEAKDLVSGRTLAAGGGIIADEEAAIALGKALFWDQQMGSDGQACASCHFHAGADNRSKNQLSPGLLRVTDDGTATPDPDTTFGNAAGKMKSGATAGPNYQLTRRDYPFHQLRHHDNRMSTVKYDTNDVTASAGSYGGTFVALGGGHLEDCVLDTHPSFQVSGLRTRKVEPRNTPTVINAIFQKRTFWDGRANNVFNGNDPFGRRNVDARILEVTGLPGTTAAAVKLELTNAALASQAVGPPLSDFEMNCSAGDFRDKGRKMLPLRPLQLQEVHAADSVLASRRHASGIGLVSTYADMIKAAFDARYWSDDASIYADGYTMMETNFPFYWGVAIQMYEATLISDDAPIHRVFDTDPPNMNILNAAERRGLDLFMGKAACIECHNGPDLTAAGLGIQELAVFFPLPEGDLERMLMGDEASAVYDNGFYNIGVRPTFEDIGLGADGPWGRPLSFTRQEQIKAAGGPAPLDIFNPDPTFFEVLPGVPAMAGERNAVDGAFKVPSLLNANLTGPYFHNGGQRTLKQVVRFYNRGGDHKDLAGGGNDTGFNRGPHPDNPGNLQNFPSNLDPGIFALGLTSSEIRDLVAFLKRPLLDVRVKKEKAPFDHPALIAFQGHDPADINPVDLKLDDIEVLIPAVGAGGRNASGVAPASLKPFLH